jgi:hypothetical protein
MLTISEWGLIFVYNNLMITSVLLINPLVAVGVLPIGANPLRNHLSRGKLDHKVPPVDE